MAKFATPLTDAEIEGVVYAFYGKVRQHPVLSPVFDTVIKDWTPHLETMVHFWSSVMNTSGRYKGKPMPKHQAIPDISPEHFNMWLGLFEETVQQECAPEIATVFIEKSQLIARSLQLGVFGLPGLSKGTSAQRV